MMAMSRCHQLRRAQGPQHSRGCRCISRARALGRPNMDTVRTQAVDWRDRDVKLGLASAVAAAMLAVVPPALADVTMVPSRELVDSAKPLQTKQKVNKSKVWLLFVGGAAALFFGTLAVENNSALFPAISRANQAMAQSKKREEQASTARTDDNAVDVETVAPSDGEDLMELGRLQGSVEAGLSQARDKVLRGEPATPSAGPSIANTPLAVSEPPPAHAGEQTTTSTSPAPTGEPDTPSKEAAPTGSQTAPSGRQASTSAAAAKGKPATSFPSTLSAEETGL